MSKNIVLCSDGTGNKGGQGDVTNVWRLYQSIDVNGHLRNPKLDRQIAFHDDGVGTEDWKPVKAITGATGWGLSRNVREFYLQLMRVYDPGDRIYLFGFSRGAFTVRVLAGLIGMCGIADRRCQNAAGQRELRSESELKELTKEAYAAYRASYQHKRIYSFRKQRNFADAEVFKEHYGVGHPGGSKDVPIRFIGAWDTVDAVGLPFDELATALNHIHPFRLPDNSLGKGVERACHAIAIDDERQTFHPVMWDESNESSGRIEQVWFAGVHSNVGGGYPKQGMSLVSLDWMMEHAECAGLRFLDGEHEDHGQRVNVHEKLYNSRAGTAVYYRYRPRDIAKFSKQNGIETPKIHYSVFDRINLGTDGYAPGFIPADFEIAVTDQAGRSPQQNSQNLAKLRNAIQAGINQHERMFRRAAWLSWFRHKIHIAFVILSVVTVLIVVANMPKFMESENMIAGGIAVLRLLGSPGELLNEAIEAFRIVWTQHKSLVWLMAGLFGVVGILGFICRSGIRSLLQDAWNRIRPLPM